VCVCFGVTQSVLSLDGRNIRSNKIPDIEIPMSGMKILLISENVPPQVNGIARRVAHYAESLKDQGHTVDLLSPGDDRCWDYSNMFQTGNRFIILKPTAVVNILSEGYDVVHCVTPLNITSTFVMLLLRLQRLFANKKDAARTHIVISWHCNLLDYSKKFFPSMLSPLLSALVFPFLVMARLADTFLVPTLSTEPPITRCLPASRVGICETGIEVTKFNPESAHSEEGKLWKRRRREDLRKHKRKYILLYVGRVSPEKGLRHIFNAMQQLEDECVLWIVGDGPMRAELERDASRLDLPVSFWGYQRGNMLYSVYTACDCFVSASVTETYGQTINEALASGVRVAIPRSAGFADAYGRVMDAKTCMWNPGDDEDMVRIIRQRLRQGTVVGRDELITWDTATRKLAAEYARRGRNDGYSEIVHVMLWQWMFCLAVVCLTLTVSCIQGVLIRCGASKKCAASVSAAATVVSAAILWATVFRFLWCVVLSVFDLFVVV